MHQKNKRVHSRRRRWLTVLVVFLVSLALTEYLISWTISRKLRAILTDRVNGEVHINRLLFVPPYGVHVWNATLTQGNHAVLNIGRLDLRLARIPLHRG